MQEKLRISITAYIHFLVDFTCAYWMFYLMMSQYGQYGRLYVPCPVGEPPQVDNSQGWILFYNFCAFALQLPVGWIVDRFAKKRSWWISSLGCLILAVTGGLIFGKRVIWEISMDSLGRSGRFYYYDLHGICYSVLLGIGNALFHVGAGVEILRLSAQGGRRKPGHRRGRKITAADDTGHWRGRITAIDDTGYRMAPVGIFVSTGALGLFLGEKAATYQEMVSTTISNYDQVLNVTSLVLIGLMLAAAWLNGLAARPIDSYYRKMNLLQKTEQLQEVRQLPEVEQLQKTEKPAACGVTWHGGIILLLFLVVVLRSFQGGIMKFPWYYSWSAIAVIFALCVTLGKAVGGILADRIGVFWTVALPLSCSALLLWFASDYVLPGLIAVLLFQTTMPVTLSLMHRQMPKHPGMAFGMLSFGLFLGTLPKLAYHLWDEKQDMSAAHYRAMYFLQDHYDTIAGAVALVSMILLLLVLFLWCRAWKRKWHYLLLGMAGLFVMLQEKAALADSTERNMTYSQTPWAPWIETVFIAMVGLMVVLAVVTIVYLHRQKERENLQQEIQRSEREETEEEKI